MRHADLMSGYYLLRETEETACEAATMGYEIETAEYWRDHPRTTFRIYLIDMTGR